VKRTLVQEVMTTGVVTAGEDMPFRHRVALLSGKGIGAVPVTGPAGQVLGVVPDSDLTAKAAGLPAVTVAPAATIEQAASIMRRRRAGRLPVTHPVTGRLAGIVTGPTCCASTCVPANRSAPRSRPRCCAGCPAQIPAG